MQTAQRFRYSNENVFILQIWSIIQEEILMTVKGIEMLKLKMDQENFSR